MSDKKAVILIEVGVLMKPEDKEFKMYSQVYDKKHGYYDESQEFRYASDFEKVKKEADDYVREGDDGTYAVITNQGRTSKEIELLDIDTASYDVKQVIYSIAKIDGKIQTLINVEEGGKA